MNLEPREGIELGVCLSQVCNHIRFLGGVISFNLVHDQLRVAVYLQVMGAELLCQLYSYNERFVFSFIVGGLEAVVKGISQLFPIGVNQDYSGASPPSIRCSVYV